MKLISLPRCLSSRQARVRPCAARTGSGTIALALALLAGMMLGGASAAHACNVPVFRYALERWPADPYDLIVFHKGPLAAGDRAIIEQLEKNAGGSGLRANLAVELVDLDGKPDAGLLKLYQTQVKPELPWMVVRYPAAARNDATIWAGRLGAAPVKALLDSPARRELVKRIGAGETAVWLLLECGDRSKDDAAAQVLQTRLEKLKTILKLPELTDSPADRVSSEGPPLRIAFSVVRIAANDPAEQMLVQMLLNTEDDLLKEKGQPMVFPVFGRGRALWAMIGKGINDDTIDEAGSFLVGPCSCQVKRLNPGTDLLVGADWEALLEGRRVVKEHEPPPLRGFSDFLSSAEHLPVPPRLEDAEPPPTTAAEFVAVPPRLEYDANSTLPATVLPAAPGARPEPTPPQASRLVLLRNIALAVLLALGAVVAATLIFKGKSPSST